MDDFLDKIPNWLRYIFAIPVGLVAVIIGYYIFYWSNLWVASPDSLMMAFCTFIYQNGLNVFVLIATMNYILPKHQIKFTLAISIIFCALGFIGLGISLLIGEITIPYIIGLITTLLAFIISCVYTFKEYYSKNNITYIDNLNTVLHNDTLLTEIIYKKKTINADLLLNKQNPYTGEIIQNYDDIIKYLKMYQLDSKNIDPRQALEEKQ